MGLTLITPPTLEPVTKEELKPSHLRIVGTEDDAYIDTLIKAARLAVEMQTGRSLMRQAWKASFDNFPKGRVIPLEKTPVISVSGLAYLDENNPLADPTSFSIEFIDGGSWEAGRYTFEAFSRDYIWGSYYYSENPITLTVDVPEGKSVKFTFSAGNPDFGVIIRRTGPLGEATPPGDPLLLIAAESPTTSTHPLTGWLDDPELAVSIDDYHLRPTFMTDPVYDIDMTSAPGRLVLKSGYSWPSITSRPGGVEVFWYAGFGDSATDVPADLKQAIAFLVAHWYRNHEPVDTFKQDIVPQTFEYLLGPYRVYHP